MPKEHEVRPLAARRLRSRLIAEADPINRPAWWSDVAVLPAVSRGRRPVSVDPPIPAVEARAALAGAATQRGASRRPDVAALVDDLARGVAPVRLPMLPEARVASRISLLIDRGEGMQPYTSDIAFLADELLAVVGRERIEEFSFAGTPLRGVDAPTGLGTAPWKPRPGSLILVLSDLGVGGPGEARDRADAREWSRVGSTARSAQAELRVLAPCPRHRWPRGLAEQLSISCWSDLGHR